MAQVSGEGTRRLAARWMRRLWPGAAWLLTLVLFLSGSAYLGDHTSLGIFSPVVAALVAVPVVLAPYRPLWAAWLLFALGLIAPVAFPPFPPGNFLPWVPQLNIAALIVLYIVGLRHDWRVLVVVGTLTIATVIWGRAVAGIPGTWENSVGPVLYMIVPLAAGYLVGARGRAQRLVVEGERRLAEVQTGRAVLEERARIARELHDVVAHHMSMIAVQAETAPFRIPDMPETSRECLAEISATARGALVEMRRLLGVLRSEDTDAERAPQPGLDRMEELVANARRAGVTVSSAVTGTPRPLPAGTDLSAYRIVQEALSNAVRHAPGASIRVETRYEAKALRILVRNDAPPGSPSQPPGPWGHGLLGMRERVAMLGGALAAGPTPDGGYGIEASLPVDAEAAS